MKTKLNLGILYLLTFTLFSFTCSSDDDDDFNSNDNTQQIAQVENIAESGTWRITSFVDSDQDETNDFTVMISPLVPMEL